MEYQPLTPELFQKPTNDYLRVMSASPEIAIADVPANVRAITEKYSEAKEQQAELLVLPELCVTGYSTADLFLNNHVIEQTIVGLQELAVKTVDGPALVVGAPLTKNGVMYNCGVMLAEGKIAGVVPKSYLPNYNEFYEKRWFSSGKDVRNDVLNIGGQEVPFGTDLLFKINNTTVGMEICEDAWATITPSAYAALAGAELIVNLSASNELVGKMEYRRSMIGNMAAKLVCGYVYTSAGRGESNADVVYGGHQMISENGRMGAEALPHTDQMIAYDLDRTELTHDRLVNKTFGDQVLEMAATRTYRTIAIDTPKPTDDTLLRYIDAHPFVPSNPEELDYRCEQIFGEMAHALAQRAVDSRAKCMVLGLSGGLDSTLALLTATKACQLLGKDESFIHTVTMPGAASSERTQDNATDLAIALGTTHKVAAIGELANNALAAIGHDQTLEDITYENTQARMRTLLLMNYANMTGGFVVGTGDLSETAQGWCTYNGDHMSMYNPNSSIPKTLVRHLVSWFAEHRTDDEAQAVLRDILDTPVSPELTGNGDLSQTTESLIGPYELHDFFKYHLQRRGERPAKVGYLATLAFAETYQPATIAKWLDSYLRRFTQNQWKREAMPNGPKIGTVSDSPRGDLRMAPNTSVNWYK